MNKSIIPKLLIVYPNQFGYHTDSYKYCEHLQKSFDIVYVCFDQKFERMDLPYVKVIYIPYNTRKFNRLFHFYSVLLSLTRREKIDIILTIRFKYCFIIGLFARSKVKILDYRSGDLRSSAISRRFYNTLMRFDALFFLNISVISDGLRDILKLAKQKTLILPLGADIISDQQRSFDRLDLIYVGTLSLRNIEQTIEGIKVFLSKHHEFSKILSYTIIGFGNEKEIEGINSCIKRTGLDHIIHFVGRKKYTDLPAYFDACNIGVTYVPITPFYEHQPVTKLFEYMLSGMPVIATGTYENRLIVNELNGVIISDTPEGFCEGLGKIYDNRNSFNSDTIRKSVQAFTWENIVNSNLKPFLLKLLE
jgi:glycosyltransferase involved in cell wall biosynthesis